MTLLLDRGASVNAVNNRGRTPLFDLLAAYVSTPAKVSILIQRSADLNIQDIDGDTALHYMMMFYVMVNVEGEIEIAKLLLDNGADIYALNEKGETPADVATRYKRTVVGAYLRERMEEHRVLQGTLKNAMTAEDC
jgi:ankyrin repeat protein